MTNEEELEVLEDTLRRLKIEYDVYFNGGSRRPPDDLEWHVVTGLRRLSEVHLTYQQRYHYNAVAQKYAIFSDLWRKKMRIKDEGVKSPQDRQMFVAGAAPRQAVPEPEAPKLRIERRMVVTGEVETRPVQKLFESLNRARANAGLPVAGELSSFESFVGRKTQQLREESGCSRVEYTIEVEGKEVRLKARAYSQ